MPSALFGVNNITRPNLQYQVEEWPKNAFSFNNAPWTIQDAIRVVRGLNRRYLWVDKYCINQRGGSDKQLMLLHMDEIYKNAEVTLVALHGDNDRSGLPGVSSTARMQQLKFETEHGCFVSSGRPLSVDIRNSTWATRGWTFQEARLSRRCLFFADLQVYFVCLHTTRSEAVPAEKDSCWIAKLLNSAYLESGLFELPSFVVGNLYRDRLVFTQRTLSYESDILDAFRGVLHDTSFISLWGVTVIPKNSTMDPCIGLSMGLLWIRLPSWGRSRHLDTLPEPTRRRRPNFPTWSWTSVTGHISNEGYGDQSAFGKYLNASDDFTLHSDAYLKFWVQIRGQSVPLHNALELSGSNLLPEESYSLLVEGGIVSVKMYGPLSPFYYIDGAEDLALRLFLEFDLDEDRASPLEMEDALVLVDWNDSQSQSKKRFVLMLITWVHEGVAERKGLLSGYKDEYDASTIHKIPKIRRKFFLQ